MTRMMLLVFVSLLLCKISCTSDDHLMMFSGNHSEPDLNIKESYVLCELQYTVYFMLYM